MPVPSFSGFKVYLRFYPHGSTEIMFNGEYLNNLNVYAILEDYTAGGFTPVITCLGFLEPSETGVMSLGASYLDNNSFSVKYYTSEYWDFTAIFQTEFSAYLYSSQIETVFIVEPTVLDFFGVIGSGGSSAPIDLTPITALIEDLNISVSASIASINPSSLLTSMKSDILTAVNNINIDLSTLDFSSFGFVSLNGNCGSFKDGTVVTIVGKIGDYVVTGSQFSWDDTTKKNSMIVYKLEKDGTFMLAPDVLVSLKVVI